MIGRTIDQRFTVTALIARGGMGKVYRAEQAPLGRLCALKVLNPNYTGEHDPEFHKRFFLEASVASKLKHPNTVTIYDYGKTDDDIYYMAMELLEGKTLHRAIRESAPFDEERAAHVGRQICRSLREAHQLGVIHRDLKPANVFLVTHGDETDVVKVLDFGLVKNVKDLGEDLTETGLFMGSPKYMAPEQIRGDRVDARTDIYSLGVMLYEMLTGRVPFDKSSSMNTLMAHVHDEVPAMRATHPAVLVSPLMEETVMRCLAKSPDARFASMDELLAALKRVGATGSLETRAADVSASIRAAAPGGAGQSAPWPSQTPPAMGSDVRASLAPPARGNGAKIAVGALAVLALGAAGALLALRPRAPLAPRAPDAVPAAPPASAPPASAPPASAPPTSAPPASAPPEALVKVRITSEPEGASVREGGVEVCTSTPCDVLYRGADADPAAEHTLVVTRAGYKPETRAIKAGEGPVVVKLAKERAAPRASPAPPRPADEPAPPTPKGFKDIPY